MKTRKNAVHRRLCPLVVAVSATAVYWNRHASAQTFAWNTGSNDWSSSTSWTPTGPPTNGSTVNILDADATNRTIFYDYPAPSSLTLTNLTVNNTGGGTNTINWSSSFNLQSLVENIGDSNSSGSSGRGAVIQDGGTNAVTNALFIGSYNDDIGTYSLSGGTLSIASATGTENVGNGGAATFNQTGGVNELPAGGSFYMAYIGGTSVYSLSSTGTLSVGGNEYIGAGGTATFNQSGGTNVQTTGTASQIIGDISNGTYIQSAGLNDQADPAASLILGGMSGVTGTYSLSGTGILSNANLESIGENGNGTFIQSGGTNTIAVSALYLGENAHSNGFYSLSAGSLMVLDGGFESIGSAGNGTFIQSGGSHQVGDSADVTNLLIGSTGAGIYSLSSTGSLSVTGAESIANSGTFSQSGGANVVSQALELGGTYLLTGGTLTAGEVPTSSAIFGESITGTFDQSGGTNSVVSAQPLYLGQHSGSGGTYLLSSGGVLSCSGTGFVGYSGTGIFTQTGGTASFSGSDSNGDSLSIGDQSTGNGLYQLTAGNLTTAFDEHIGNVGTGSFAQTGGTNTIQTSLFIGGPTPSSGGGEYDLSLGTLSAAVVEVVGWGSAGTFAQSGGTNISTGNLDVGDATGSSGVYTLSAGSMTVGGENIGRFGTGTFIQTGGTNNLTTGQSLSIGVIDTGSYSLSGTGVLNVANGLFVGGGAGSAGDTGTFSISAGQLTVTNRLEVWNSLGTIFDVSGGTVSAGSTINLATINVTGGSANLGPITGTGTLNIGDAIATVTASGLQQSSVTITSTGELTLTAGGATNAINSLVINSGGILNLTSTKLLINYGVNPDPAATIYNLLKTGDNSGTWTGAGIDSSTAALPANNAHYGLGFVDGKDNIPGASVTTGQIEIAYALYGDVNLDGLVNATDFAIFGANFNKSITGWEHGDFTYTGLVNGTDFALLGENFGKSAVGTSVALPSSDWAALDAFAVANDLSIPNVPEPTTLGLSLLGAIGLLQRRVRRRTQN